MYILMMSQSIVYLKILFLHHDGSECFEGFKEKKYDAILFHMNVILGLKHGFAHL